MARLILRLLWIGVWLGCVLVVGAVLGERTPTPPIALAFAQKDQVGRSHTRYYDPDYGLTVSRIAPDANWAATREQAAIQDSLYISPRMTSTGIDLFIVSQSLAIERQLTYIDAFPPTISPFPKRRNNTYPQWSPERGWIAFISTDALANMDLYLIRLNGSDLRLVARDLGTPTPLMGWRTIPQRDSDSLPMLVVIALVLAAFGLFRHLR